jgi:ATP synthase protein I
MSAEEHRPERPGEEARRQLSRRLAARQARKLRAQRQRDQSAWFGLGMFGLVGWSVAIPAILFIALGVWIDARSSGAHSWTLMLLVIGIGLGCVNAWFWISRERREIERKHRDDREEKRDDDH